MGNSVSSPGGKIAIAGGAVVLAWGASFLWDFLSDDGDEFIHPPSSVLSVNTTDDHSSSKSTEKSSASASSTPDAPVSGITNKLADQEALTDTRKNDGYANGRSEVLSIINHKEDLSSKSTEKSSASASSTTDAPVSGIRNKLAEEALTDTRNNDGSVNGRSEDDHSSSKSTEKSSASASSTRDASASVRNKLADQEALTDTRKNDGYANGRSEVLSIINSKEGLSSKSTKKRSASASSKRDASASVRYKLAEKASVTLRSEFPRRISGNPMPQVITIVTYNIWQKDVKLNERMKAIGELMQAVNMPDIILFQEVTHKIRKIFKEFKWWQQYKCVSHKTPTTKHYSMMLCKLPVKVLSLEHCKDSIMKKKLIVAEVEVLGKRRSLVIANGHLKRPNLPDESHTKKRTAQAKETITILGNYKNAIFGGDMNWSEDLDGCFPLPNGWVDAWKYLRPREKGWTYDTVTNQMMIKGRRKLRKRLDRFLCKLKDYKLEYIEIIGKEIIPGLKHQCREKDYPVLCSDHFGLLLRISIRKACN